MTVRRKALLALFIVAVLWGSAGATAKLLLRELHPFVILFYRFSIASAFMIPFFLRTPKPKNYLRVLIPFSVLSFLNALFFYIGIGKTTSNAAYIINTSTPLVTAVFSRLLIGELTSARKLAGIAVGLVGTLFIIVLPVLTRGDMINGNFAGNIFVFLALVCWTIYMVGNRHYVSTNRFSPVLLVSLNFFTTAALCGLLALSTGQQMFTPALLRPSYLLLLLYVAVPVTVVTFGLFQWTGKHISATSAAMKDYVQLVVAIGLNGLLLGERLTIYYGIGTLLVGTGILTATGHKILRNVHR